jgi:4-hydroxybenzoate polyprenyltransferase
MFDKIRSLLEMIRFSHTLFALPFALLGAVMAWSINTDVASAKFRWQQLVGILICMAGARSAAMAFNRLADRKIDAANPRTAGRHIPSGQLSVGAVVLFTAVSATVFVAGTLLFLPNWLPLALSIPVLMILLAYSYTKRFTSLAHFWLGLSLMLAPVSAWIAIRGEIVLTNPIDVLPAVILGLVVMFWVAGFDIIYACQDFEFDRQSKLKSIPAKFGVAVALRIAAASHFVMIVMLCLLPWALMQVPGAPGFGLVYGIAVVAVAVLLAYEHWIVRPDDLTRVNVAFFNVNIVVSIGLFIVGLIDLHFV